MALFLGIREVTLSLLCLLSFSCLALDSQDEVDAGSCKVWGPGLKTRIVLPVRYFYIQAVNKLGDDIKVSVGKKAFSVNLYLAESGQGVRARVEVLDRNDGSYIVRYKMYESVKNIKINVMFGNQHLPGSPFNLDGMVYHEKCDCPAKDIKKWMKMMNCPPTYDQIEEDLSPFSSVDIDEVADQAINRFNKAGMHSLCQYRIIDNMLYRKTYGQHVGFKMFMDNVLLSILRKVTLPDMEFFTNLGDWPLVKKKSKDKVIPLFSWCGSNETSDIVMPTYDIMESTLEMLGRTTLDLFSVQANTGPKWKDKEEKGFWRGRDSREERLNLVVMSKRHPDLMDAALTHMFFFPKDPQKYGELVKSISFFDFFKYKYQINIDGTVAAYRMPYLLAGDALVFKQQSSYYEHFYRDLIPDVHYIPFKHDLSDLLEKIQWAKTEDKKAFEIAKAGQQFVREHLEPTSIYCYHVKLFEKYAKLLKKAPKSSDGFELVPQPSDHDAHCDCSRSKKKKKEEL